MLTLMRLILIPFIILSIVYEQWSLALCLFVIAAITDLLDGAFARLFDEQTEVGAYLDPVADKLLILSCYITLSVSSLPASIIPRWLVITVFVKELVLIIGAVYYGLMQRTLMVQATWLGKAAMLAQTVWIFWILLLLFAGRTMFGHLLFLHYLVFILVLLSCINYVVLTLRGTRLWYLLKRAF
jgi:cardiolipin synthase (CMP-forming)